MYPLSHHVSDVHGPLFDINHKVLIGFIDLHLHMCSDIRMVSMIPNMQLQ